MAAKHYSSSDMPPVSKHLWRSPGWMPAPQYREYQKHRAEDACAERDKARQEERHNAFLENAKKHGIPVHGKK